MTISGKLHGWFETGLEGTVWALHEDGKEGYDGLHVIEKNDKLIIFTADGKRELVKLIITPDFKVGIPKGERQQVSCGLWVHWIQKKWNPDAWGILFLAELPAILEKHEKVVLRKE